MRSKTSCFNATLFRKNMTRFAPAWGLYTLCLVMGTLLLYTNGGTSKAYHFANHMMDMGQIMTIINLFYAPIAAMLLFGDLYNNRMCYAIHAMPLKREQILLTNITSGLLFSLLPTAVMTVLATLLMRGSCFVNAWQIPLYTFVAVNLEFICFFGLSVLCVMCTGSRLAMGIVYGILNFGAQIAYWLVDTVYTPMLYGVVTPVALANNLTPVKAMTENPLFEMDSYSDLYDRFQADWSKAVAHFNLTDNWSYLYIWAAMGIVFLVLALVLYRKRNLECAADAVAFPILEPVFGVLFAIISACFAQFMVTGIIGYSELASMTYLFLGVGLIVGWFAGRMLIERTTRVFRIKNWLGLGILSAVLAMSLVMTHFDIFGIVTWQPKAEDLQAIRFGTWYQDNAEFTEEEDIQRILAIQEDALAERLENSGPYVIGVDGNWIYNIDSNAQLLAKDAMEIQDCRYAYRAHIEYQLKSGKTVNRIYNVWADGESGDTARELLSRWEIVNRRNNFSGQEDRLQLVMSELQEFFVDGMEQFIRDPDRALVEGLLEAIEKDCAENHMAQNYYLHTGYFEAKKADDRGNKYTSSAIYVSISGEHYGWSLEIYPDSVHSIRYLQEHDLLYYDLREGNLHYN